MYHTAEEVGGRAATYRFRSIDALARRIGGRTAFWETVSGGGSAIRDKVQILRPNRLAGGSDIVAVVMVPVESVP